MGFSAISFFLYSKRPMDIDKPHLVASSCKNPFLQFKSASSI
jgi:hypothetical protein